MIILRIMLSDPGTVMLLIGTLLGVYGFILFLWWWIRIGSATEVYAYVCFFFGTAGVMMGFGVVSRVLHDICGYECYERFIHSRAWTLKSIPLLVVMFLIVLRMTIRVIYTFQYEKGTKRERRTTLTKGGKR